jgi:hypothetical protein
MVLTWIAAHVARAGLSIFCHSFLMLNLVFFTPEVVLIQTKLLDFVQHTLMMVSTFSPALAH